MERWRGTLVQLACVGAVVVLGITPSPDQTMKLLSLVIVGMIGGAAVTRSKLDALAQAAGGPSTPAGIALASLAALTSTTTPPPSAASPPAAKIVMRADQAFFHPRRTWWPHLFRWGLFVGAIVAAVLLGACSPSATELAASEARIQTHNLELAACHEKSMGVRDAGADAIEARGVFLTCARGVNRRHGVVP